MHPNLGILSITFGSIIGFGFGTWTESLSFLLVLMAVDYVSGVAASLRDGKGLSSEVGFWGLAKKGLMLLIVIVAHRIDLVLGADVAMGGAVYFYIVNELLSVMENYGRLGLPMPDRLREVIRILRNRAERKDDDPSK
ncbi:phage holin family protein [Cohnella thailandensis]|uniref:Phage holin family protein n=1 Tax=Cohnella thailandensis TaxID=557557 RepID=A0A841T839_9BACL|nr:phage holin family protein [Cohnella thailandensis]MBB6638230.1 phage holin family protein [Cohnella thailandensis]MBP1977791.1 toxin secretion/phage lysis holin [Cohnella thailandensis]